MIPTNGMPMRSNVIPKPMTGTQATAMTASSFTLAESPRTSSTMPTAATSGMPMTMPRIAPVQVEEQQRRDEDADRDRQAADPRGIGRLWMRGRSPP